MFIGRSLINPTLLHDHRIGNIVTKTNLSVRTKSHAFFRTLVIRIPPLLINAFYFFGIEFFEQ